MPLRFERTSLTDELAITPKQINRLNLSADRSCGPIRLYVLVKREEVRWIVFGFQGSQTVVFLAVGHADALLTDFAEVIDVRCVCQEGLHGFPKLACPTHIGVCICWVRPHCRDYEVIRPIAVSKCSCVSGNTTEGTVAIVLNNDYGSRRGGLRVKIKDRPLGHRKSAIDCAALYGID